MAPLEAGLRECILHSAFGILLTTKDNPDLRINEEIAKVRKLASGAIKWALSDRPNSNFSTTYRDAKATTVSHRELLDLVSAHGDEGESTASAEGYLSKQKASSLTDAKHKHCGDMGLELIMSATAGVLHYACLQEFSTERLRNVPESISLKHCDLAKIILSEGVERFAFTEGHLVELHANECKSLKCLELSGSSDSVGGGCSLTRCQVDALSFRLDTVLSIEDSTIRDAHVLSPTCRFLYSSVERAELEVNHFEAYEASGTWLLKKAQMKTVRLGSLLHGRARVTVEPKIVSLQNPSKPPFSIESVCLNSAAPTLTLTDGRVGILHTYCSDLSSAIFRNVEIDQACIDSTKWKGATLSGVDWPRILDHELCLDGQAILDQPPGLREQGSGSNPTDTLYNAYRALRAAYDEEGDQIQAAKFFKKEMEYLAKSTSSGWDKAMLWLRGATSSFGQSWIRPVVWLLVGQCILACITLGFGVVSPQGDKYSCSFLGDDCVFIKVWVETLFPTHRYLGQNSGGGIALMIGRVLNAFLLFQVVAGFRRFQRR